MKTLASCLGASLLLGAVTVLGCLDQQPVEISGGDPVDENSEGLVCGTDCTPGAKRCEANVAKTCTSSGTWSNVTCNGTCTDGVCSGECVPGAMRCKLKTPATCSSAGKWVNGSACAVA